MDYKSFLTVSLLCIGFFSACKKESTDPIVNTIPEFYKPAPQGEYGKTSPTYRVIANESDAISSPNDLDFNPTRTGELWIINEETEMTGGTTVTIFNAGESNQTTEHRKDGNAFHFMSLPTALAWSTNGNWATTAGVLDANHGSDTYTGPTLWSGDLNIYAKPSGFNGSHLDMLHGSPFCMGVASEKDNVYWVYDGYNGHICRYDFGHDHGPGMEDHSDGKIHRYTEVKVKRTSLPSHMVLDKGTGWLYICDGGNNRILRMKINSGSKKGDLPLINEPLAEHFEMGNVEWEVFIADKFQQPVGIEIKENRLFVSDYTTGEIIAFDTESKGELGRINTGKSGITGIVIGPDGKLWYVNKGTKEVVQVQPN